MSAAAGASGVMCSAADVCVVCGVWSVECGVWCVVCGVWCVHVCAERRIPQIMCHDYSE